MAAKPKKPAALKVVPTIKAPEGSPTVEEARAMFEERPDLASVHTVEGVLNRDGSFSGERVLTLSGTYVAKAEDE